MCQIYIINLYASDTKYVFKQLTILSWQCGAQLILVWVLTEVSLTSDHKVGHEQFYGAG